MHHIVYKSSATKYTSQLVTSLGTWWQLQSDYLSDDLHMPLCVTMTLAWHTVMIGEYIARVTIHECIHYGVYNYHKWDVAHLAQLSANHMSSTSLLIGTMITHSDATRYGVVVCEQFRRIIIEWISLLDMSVSVAVGSCDVVRCCVCCWWGDIFVLQLLHLWLAWPFTGDELSPLVV